VNPAETCLTPPPETTTSQSECEDATVSATAAAVCGTMDQGSVQQQAPVTVQDASNQTDTPPVSEDENCCESVPLQEKLHQHDLLVSLVAQCVLRFKVSLYLGAHLIPVTEGQRLLL
jgi:hypothetical protein